MTNNPMTNDAEATRHRALSMANRVTLVFALAVWIGMIVARFSEGGDWRLMAGIVPMIPLIWHGSYLRFKRTG
ncbi:MAG: hypothetical protein JSW50_03530 [Candidatus Latescibacterota bacterium]|nr:MAG: hypothetical protein JSW50_03530 [Candidatus Latescibacterota bacterium]